MRFAGPLLLTWLLPSLSGCGHPASQQECELIFRRSAELELRAQQVTDPKIVAQRIEEARQAKGDKLLADCLGKRITDAAVECVRGAKSSQELDKCLR